VGGRQLAGAARAVRVARQADGLGSRHQPMLRPAGGASGLAGADGVDDAAGSADELHRVGVVAVARGVHVAAADPYPDVRAPTARGDQVTGLERAEVDVRERAALRAGRRRDAEAARPPRAPRQARAVEAVAPETRAGA